jgi:hypothetical protein
MHPLVARTPLAHVFFLHAHADCAHAFFEKVCVRGRHVMMGYLDDPLKTTKAVDLEG